MVSALPRDERRGRRMGRPKGEPKRLGHYKLPVWLDDALREIAEREDVTYSSLAEQAITQWIAAHHPEFSSPLGCSPPQGSKGGATGPDAPPATRDEE